MDLNEARRNLENCFGEELRKQYFQILRKCLLFYSPTAKLEFDNEIAKLLTNEEQIRAHDDFILALLLRKNTGKAKAIRSNVDKGAFELTDFVDYLHPASPTILPPSEIENRNAASELFMPDVNFVATRIAVTMWDYGLDGAADDVTELIVHACHVFVKNIITAMISRKKGYKIRDNKLQYGFNLPIPDPFKKNYQNFIDDDTHQDMKVENVGDVDESFIPRRKTLLENSNEQQASFVYSCTKKGNTDNMLTVRLLYETLRDNPTVLGSNEMYNTSILKLGLQLYED